MVSMNKISTTNNEILEANVSGRVRLCMLVVYFNISDYYPARMVVIPGQQFIKLDLIFYMNVSLLTHSI